MQEAEGWAVKCAHRDDNGDAMIYIDVQLLMRDSLVKLVTDEDVENLLKKAIDELLDEIIIRSRTQ